MNKRNIVYFILAIVIISLSISMLTKDDIETKILTNKQIISTYHTDQTEEVMISLLTTNPNSFYFDKDYITFTSLFNEKQTVSLKLSNIKISYDEYDFQGETYYLVECFFNLPFTGTNTYINMTDVNLAIDYDNGESIELFVGEFNYLFAAFNDDDISLGNLSGTYEYIDEVETIGGINLTLKNIANNNINITNIRILSSDVRANYGETIEREECNYLKTVNECLYKEYNPNNYTSSDQTFLIRENNSIDLYIPLSYLNNTDYLYRFSIIIEYELNGEAKEYIIDDFPYMSKGIYIEEMEDNYHEGIFSN